MRLVTQIASLSSSIGMTEQILTIHKSYRCRSYIEKINIFLKYILFYLVCSSEKYIIIV